MRTEWFPLVNEKGETIGKATRKECHSGSKLLHPVIHLHIFNKDGDLYLQKRSMNKDIQPGKWDTAVGGHVDLGESVEMALRREAEEELGLTGFTPERLPYYVFESDRERELVFPHRCTYDGEIRPSAETDGGRFWSTTEIHEAMGKGICPADTGGSMEPAVCGGITEKALYRVSAGYSVVRQHGGTGLRGR